MPKSTGPRFSTENLQKLNTLKAQALAHTQNTSEKSNKTVKQLSTSILFSCTDRSTNHVSKIHFSEKNLKPHSNDFIIFIATFPKIHTPYSAANTEKKELLRKGNFTTGNPIFTLQNLCMCVYK